MSDAGGCCCGSVAGRADARDVGVSPKMVDESAQIVSNERIAESIWRIDMLSPTIARTAEPGQFVHMRIPNLDGHVLRRPFSIADWDREATTISVIYQTVGVGTRKLTEALPGDSTKLIGPIGRGWSVPGGISKALLVCGGVGVASLAMLARQLADAGVDVRCLIGATTAARLVGVDLAEDGVDVRVATDDGSQGHCGFCTELIPDAAEGAGYVAVCGPGPMEVSAMREIAALPAGLLAEDVRMEVSLERRMACGIGACLSCVVDTVAGRKRACVDGPVFDASEVIW